MTTQHDANLNFLQSKSFDTSSLPSLRQALAWLRTTDGDNLMYGEPSGEEFDKMVDYFALRKALIRQKESIGAQRGKQ